MNPNNVEQQQQQNKDNSAFIATTSPLPNNVINFQAVDANVKAADAHPNSSSSLPKPAKMGHKDRTCAYCGKVGRFKKCSACHSAYYCSKEHQVADWEKHKTKCVELKASRLQSKSSTENNSANKRGVPMEIESVNSFHKKPNLSSALSSSSSSSSSLPTSTLTSTPTPTKSPTTEKRSLPSTLSPSSVPPPSETPSSDCSPPSSSQPENDSSSNLISSSSIRASASPLQREIEGYFKQVIEGCGNPLCDNIFCGSNPGVKKWNLTKNDAAKIALKLTSRSIRSADFSCSPPPLSNPPPNEPEFLDLTKLVAMITEAKAHNDYKSLIRLFGHPYFDTSECLNISFLKHPLKVDINGSDCGLDLQEVREAWKILKELPDNVYNVIANAFERLLHELRHKPPTTIAQLRQLIIMLENPNLADPTRLKTLMGPLLLCLARLPQSLKEWMKEYYFGSFDKDKFHFFHSMLQTYIALRVELASEPFILNRDEQIVACVQVLDILYHVNEKKKFSHYSLFYNDAVNEYINLREDYLNWKRRMGFSFCTTPWILTPETKSRILSIDSAVEQRRQRDQSFQMLLMGIENEPFLVLRIRRDHLIQDSLEEILRHKREDLTKELKIKFVGEEGVDQGGVAKEWFQLLVRHIFDRQYGMFIHNEETKVHWFNGNSKDLLEFELIGTLLGLAIYNSVILDLHFPLVVYKKLLGEPVGLDDLDQLNPGLAKGLRELLNYDKDDVEEVFCLTFQVTYDYWGQQQFHDLVPNGANIPVTKANKNEFVNLYVNWLLNDSIDEQFKRFLKGFKTVVREDLLVLFRAEELELLICGDPELDFTELEKGTRYDGGYSEDHPTIRAFWEVVHGFSQEEKKRLLFFATGSDRSPIGGLSKLGLVIARQGPDSDRLPTAHTCFNHLLLPEYKSKEKLKEKLKKAINNAEGFGLL